MVSSEGKFRQKLVKYLDTYIRVATIKSNMIQKKLLIQFQVKISIIWQRIF